MPSPNRKPASKTGEPFPIRDEEAERIGRTVLELAAQWQMSTQKMTHIEAIGLGLIGEIIRRQDPALQFIFENVRDPITGVQYGDWIMSVAPAPVAKGKAH